MTPLLFLEYGLAAAASLLLCGLVVLFLVAALALMAAGRKAR